MATVPQVQEQDATASASTPLGEKETFAGKKSGTESEGEAQRGKGSELILVGKGLPIEVKRFIVESFACFQDISTIQREVAKRYGIAADLRTIAKYDARRPQCAMGKALRLYYAQCREAYVQGVAEVAVAHQAHRLRLLSRIVDKATTSKDYANAIKGLELAAKEMGGALTSQHTVKHEGTVAHVHATVEEARAEITARLQQVVDGGLLLPSPTEGGAG